MFAKFDFQLRQSEQTSGPDRCRQDQPPQRQVLGRRRRRAGNVAGRPQGRERRLGRDSGQGLEVRVRGQVLLRPVPALAQRESRG